MSKFRVLSVVIATVLVLLAGLPAAATPEPAVQTAPAGNQDAPGAFLTGPNQGDALDIALAYLQQAGESFGLAAGDLADLAVTDRYTTRHNGVTHVYLRQRLGGIEVFGANVNINIAADGSVISMGEALIPGLSKAVNSDAPALSAAQAIEAAAASLGLKLSQSLEVMESSGGADQAMLFSDGGISLEPIPAKLVYQPVADGAVRLAWNVAIYQLDALHWWDMRVDAESGKVLDRFDYVVNDSFSGPAPAGSQTSLAGGPLGGCGCSAGGGRRTVHRVFRAGGKPQPRQPQCCQRSGQRAGLPLWLARHQRRDRGRVHHHPGQQRPRLH